MPREEEEQIEELKEEVEKLKKECAVVEFENMCVNNSWKKRETQWMDDFEELKEQLQQEKDGRCCDLDELEKEIEELKRGVTLWKKRAMGINIVSRLVEKEETIEKLKATCLRWQEKADFNLTDSEEEEDMEEHIDTIDAETGEKIVYSDFLTTSEEEEEEKCEECGKCLEGEDKCGEGCPAYDKGWLETHSEEEEDMEREEKLLNAQIEGEQE